MCTNESTARQPNDISASPSFAELVCYYLPEVEWYKGYTINNTKAEGLQDGPMTSILDKYHYEALLKEDRCDKNVLERAWKEWLYWGEFKNGEQQRNNLYSGFREWGLHRRLYAEIQEGLYGSEDKKQAFQKKWYRKGMEEAGKYALWTSWDDLEELNEGVPEPTRDFECVWDPRRNPDDYLGERLYQDRYD